jgi:small subunit ribosomal protein S6
LTRQYELVLMLDPDAPDKRRDQIADAARKRIESAGELKHAESWGMRKMSYEIRQRTEADYRYYRFESDGPLLEELDHNLKITDGVLRFRIFKVDASTPMIVPPPAMQPARAGRADTRRPRRGRGAPAPEEAPEEAPPAEEEPPADAEVSAEPPEGAGDEGGEPEAAAEGAEEHSEAG